jgi:peptidoglycan/xylan/chitin deacetylase (PgdA/CDA1 family)
MKPYWVKTNQIVKFLFPNYIWSIPGNKRVVYLTFDDGPTPEVTEWTLAQLNKYNAQATFFCIGNNIQKHPEIFNTIVQNGHAIGNHTFSHINGWETNNVAYIQNVKDCEVQLSKLMSNNSNLFRPPYGKVSLKQARMLRKMGYKIIMWDILTADFDTTISPQQCVDNVLKNICPGTIIIFHDSVKAFKNLEYALPETLKFLDQNGYKCEVLY